MSVASVRRSIIGNTLERRAKRRKSSSNNTRYKHNNVTSVINEIRTRENSNLSSTISDMTNKTDYDNNNDEENDLTTLEPDIHRHNWSMFNDDTNI